MSPEQKSEPFGAVLETSLQWQPLLQASWKFRMLGSLSNSSNDQWKILMEQDASLVNGFLADLEEYGIALAKLKIAKEDHG